MDKLAEIETFIDVVCHGSFAGAARARNETAVIVGRRIAQLERRLGGRLFHRTTRSLTMTPEAETFLQNCRDVVAHLQDAERLVADSATRATGHLMVTATAAFGWKHIFPHLKDFMTRNPDVRVSLQLTDQVIDIAREGFDIGIRIGVEPDPALDSVVLISSGALVCGSPEYFARHGVPLQPEELEAHNCLSFIRHDGQQNKWLFERDGQPLRLLVDGNHSCNDGQTLKQWAMEGLGLAWLPDYDVADEIASGRLVTTLDRFAHPHRGLTAVYRPEPPVKTILFVAWQRAILARLGCWPSRTDRLPNLVS